MVDALGILTFYRQCGFREKRKYGSHVLHSAGDGLRFKVAHDEENESTATL